jgi:glycosyltransferase involved in cell wall biosynthesis
MVKMKILFLATGIKKGCGGIQGLSHDYSQSLRRLGHDQRLIAINDDFSRYGLLKKPLFIVNVLWTVLSFKPDLIICGHINFSLLCFLFRKILKRKYIVVVHGIEVWNLSFFGRIGLKGAKAVVSVSEYTKEKIRNQIPRLKTPFFIVPPTVDGRVFKPMLRSEKLLEEYGLGNSKIVLTVARLSSGERYKGYDKVIKAITRVPETKYLLVGHGDDLPRLKALVRKLGLEERVVFCGFLSQQRLIDCYNLCDVFVMPSKGEGFGIVFLEALACGKPVIAGNQDASKEALLHGELGLLVDPDNVEEIAEAIIRILTKNVDPKVLDGQYLRKRVLEIYGFEKFQERVKQLIEDLN